MFHPTEDGLEPRSKSRHNKKFVSISTQIHTQLLAWENVINTQPTKRPSLLLWRCTFAKTSACPSCNDVRNVSATWSPKLTSSEQPLHVHSLLVFSLFAYLLPNNIGAPLFAQPHVVSVPFVHALVTAYTMAADVIDETKASSRVTGSPPFLFIIIVIINKLIHQ